MEEILLEKILSTGGGFAAAVGVYLWVLKGRLDEIAERVSDSHSNSTTKLVEHEVRIGVLEHAFGTKAGRSNRGEVEGCDGGSGVDESE